MTVFFHTDFKKAYKKLPAVVRKHFDERFVVFQNYPRDPILHNHSLHGEFKGYRSINITGDFRVIYREIGKDVVELVKIGTHHELFGS
jgi:addiction module RelE/StbE family toxin